MRQALFGIFFSILTSTIFSQELTNTYSPPIFTDQARIEKIKSTKDVVDRLFKARAETAHYPAVVYGVVVDGQLVYTGNTGYTNLQKKTLADENSAFRIASMSKSVTAMAIMQLRDAGKLKLDDPAYLYIPQLKQLKYLTKDAPPITIRHLLSHSAGLPQDDPWADRHLDDTDAELLNAITSGVNFSNIPGVAFEYSNLGYALLGKIITNVSGKPYQQYIIEKIFKPLDMNSSYYDYTKVPDIKLAHGYRWINGDWREEELLHDGSYGAMGGMITNIEDFAKYTAFHMKAWPPSDSIENPVLNRSSTREMHQPWMITGLNSRARLSDGTSCPVVAGYGYGLGWTKDCHGKVFVGHSGGLPGFGSNWSILPEYGIGVISFANVTYAGTGGVNNIALDTIIKLAGLQPRLWKASPVLQQRKKQLIQLLPTWKDAEKSGIFAENFFKDYIIDSLKKQSESIFKEAGMILKIKELVPQNNLRGSFIMEGENQNILIFFTLTPEATPLVQELRFQLQK